MIWDAQDRRYEDEDGNPVSAAQVRQHIEEFITSEKKQVSDQSQQLFARAITVDEFFAFMRQKIAAWHRIAGAIAYGGEGQM